MPPRVLRAYNDWRYAAADGEAAALQRLVAAAMDDVDKLADLISYENVLTAVTQGGRKSTYVGMLVAGAWRLYLLRRPSGPDAAAEATAWIEQLVPNRLERHRVFEAVLDNLVKQVG